MVTGAGTLHLVDASGAVTATIGGVYFGADWSPDGRRLAYVAQSGDSSRIFVADADGGGAREVRQDDLPAGWNGPLVWVSSNEIAVHHRVPTASSYTLWIVPVDGGPRRLVTDPADLNFPLAMQPHGSLLVYSVTTSNGVRRAVVDVRTGATTILPVTAALVWSPDGRLLAAPAANGIELLRPDGSRPEDHRHGPADLLCRLVTGRNAHRLRELARVPRVQRPRWDAEALRRLLGGRRRQ